MAYTLYLTPSGGLRLQALPEESSVIIGERAWEEKVVGAFESSSAAGLFTLAAEKTRAVLPVVWSYWRGLSQAYLIELCKAGVGEPGHEDDPLLPEIPFPDKAFLSEMLLSAPPMQGGEYLTYAVLEKLWAEMDQWRSAALRDSQKSLSDWLRERAPAWNQVGRVCFHLAENKKDPEYPFAFMATYSPSISQQGNAQHQPLGQALKQYAGQENKSVLENLLTPIQRAAETLPFIEEMIESNDIFYPLSWTPDEAFQMLKHTDDLEAAGLIVRLPNWWRKRSKPTVSVSVGNKKNKDFGMNVMLDFQMEVTLGGRKLTQEEWKQIMESTGSLTFIKGQWVEVNREKLQEALNHWKRVEEEVSEGGISFLEGMRLLAGAPSERGFLHSDAEDVQWSTVRAGDWLESTLAQLRSPRATSPKSSSSAFQGTLRPYQQAGKDWLHLLVSLGLGGCLADDMGLGKTVQIISLLTTLKEETPHPSPPSLLVLPASLIANWKGEIEKFSPDLKVLIIHRSFTSLEEIQEIAENPEAVLRSVDVILTTYGMLSRQPWLLKQDWKLAILDEAQAIKNPNSNQTKAVKQLKAQSRIALTGTPVENKLVDLWSLFDYLAPGLLGNMEKFNQFISTLEKRERDQFSPLRNLISPYILRRLKTDKSIISDLPDKTEIKTYCGLSKVQAGLYQASVEELKESLEELDGIQRRGLIFSFLMRFKQICNHPSQLLNKKQYPIEESGKLQRLVELCEEISERQEKVLIFTQFREMTTPLAEVLQHVFNRSGLILHGSTSVKKRQEMVKEFQDPEGPPFFILSLKAGGTGLTLTAASHVIHYDRWWNPAVENQATDRAFRIGQKRNVLVHKFICKGTLEEKIDSLIEGKAKMATELLEGDGSPLLTEMSNEELIKIVSLDIDQSML